MTSTTLINTMNAIGFDTLDSQTMRYAAGSVSNGRTITVKVTELRSFFKAEITYHRFGLVTRFENGIEYQDDIDTTEIFEARTCKETLAKIVELL